MPVGTYPGTNIADQPTLAPFQFWFQGKTFGQNANGSAANGVSIKEWDGLDVEEMRSGDAVQPRTHGEYPGYDFLKGRDITVKFDCQGSTPAVLQQNMATLSGCMIPQANQESAFYINLPYYNTLASPDGGNLYVSARPRNRSWKVDTTYALGSLAQDLTALFHATDPRFYSPTQFTTASGTSPLTLYLTNNGNIECLPRVTITGEANSPQLILAGAGSAPNQTIGFGSLADMATGESITVDLYAHTAGFNDTSDPIYPCLYMLTGNPQWWSLAPAATAGFSGANKVVYSWSGGGSASIYVTWASTWLL